MSENMQIALALISPMLALMTFMGGLAYWIWSKVQTIRKTDKAELKEFVVKSITPLLDELKEMNRAQRDSSKVGLENREAINRIEGVLIGKGLVSGNIRQGFTNIEGSIEGNIKPPN